MVLPKECSYYWQKHEQYKKIAFETYAKFVLSNIIEPQIETFLETNFYSKSGTDFVSVVLDDRPSELLKFCILNTLIMTRKQANIIVYTSEDSYKSMCELFSQFREYVSVLVVDCLEKNRSISKHVYNLILKSPSFWKCIPCEKILIVQADALLIQPFDSAFLDFDYIGSPWVQLKSWTPFNLYSKYIDEKPGIGKIDININTFPSFQNYHLYDYSLVNLDRLYKIPVGNGGLSIRSKSLMIEACECFETSSDEPEDVFFSRILSHLGATLPSLDEAKTFSCEGEYSVSMGMHAAFRYLTPSVLSVIYDRHLKSICSLLKL